ncbi:hypothetical protein E2F46_01800 [Luteimonas aestuarii]|uniref:Uncharacterized protein n=1 Tax=Luteimonas aestuarii TaxID=453837 RepID=A0A4R5U4R8_9GAMM|nr:hypothetical protein [Luteimonas aestuarii]TDK28639.1 hypothetical protein E2F46_01800 [Luteimonas aestuarii]
MIVKTIPTRSGEVTLVVSDTSEWRAEAIGWFCEQTVQRAIRRLQQRRTRLDEEVPMQQEQSDAA